jgi:hypothetical protein
MKARTFDDFIDKHGPVPAHAAELGHCWVWTGYLDRGYGRYRSNWAHRHAWKTLVGAIPEGLQLDHLCRNPPCVNPKHLEPVTSAENMRRRKEAHTTCFRGHEYTPENTYLRARGFRQCRTCNREAVDRYAARKRSGRSA